MFTVSGAVVAVNEKKIQKGDNAGKSFQEIQIMTGDQYKTLHKVTDFNNLPVHVGQDLTLAVRIKAFAYRNGNAGLDMVTVRDQAQALAEILAQLEKAA